MDGITNKLWLKYYWKRIHSGAYSDIHKWWGRGVGGSYDTPVLCCLAACWLKQSQLVYPPPPPPIPASHLWIRTSIFSARGLPERRRKTVENCPRTEFWNMDCDNIWYGQSFSHFYWTFIPPSAIPKQYTVRVNVLGLLLSGLTNAEKHSRTPIYDLVLC